MTQRGECVKHVPDHREHWRNSGKQKICYRERKKKGKGRDGEKGEQRKGNERRGTVGRMTGWERHSLRSISGVKVGKAGVQELGTGGHTFMLTKVCVSEERQ